MEEEEAREAEEGSGEEEAGTNGAAKKAPFVLLLFVLVSIGAASLVVLALLSDWLFESRF